MNERELIEHLQDLKRQLEAGLRDLTKMQDDAGRMEAKNAVFGIRARLNVWHSEATKELFTHFPDFAADIVARGPR